MVDEARSTEDTLSGLIDAGQMFSWMVGKGSRGAELQTETGGWQVGVGEAGTCLEG